MILVAVAILVGVFVAATGRGGELAYEQADHAPLDLDPVSATDVAMLRPPTALWGYNMQVTDEALEQIARALRDRDVTIAYLQQRLTAPAPDPIAPDPISPRPHGPGYHGPGSHRPGYHRPGSHRPGLRSRRPARRDRVPRDPPPRDPETAFRETRETASPEMGPREASPREPSPQELGQ